MLADAVTLIGHASYLASLKRREFLKPDISSAYQSVCSKSNPVTTFPFGDELPKHIKDIGEVNKISRRPWQGSAQLGIIYLNIRAIILQTAVWTAWKDRSFFRIKRLQQGAVPE